MEPQAQLINLPHALTIVGRLVYYLEYRTEPVPAEETRVREILAELDRILRPFPTDPPAATAIPVAKSAAAQARLLVAEMATAGYTSARLGQCIRNLFECLGLPEEGAAASLECGERPDSPMRP